MVLTTAAVSPTKIRRHDPYAAPPPQPPLYSPVTEPAELCWLADSAEASSSQPPGDSTAIAPPDAPPESGVAHPKAKQTVHNAPPAQLMDHYPLTASALCRRLRIDGKRRPIDVPCPPGGRFDVFSYDVSRHYCIPSELVQITRGAIAYVEHFAKYGHHMRFRFQLCNKYCSKTCTRLSECTFIHATSLPRHTLVHLNPSTESSGRVPQQLPRKKSSPQDDSTIICKYKTLPPGSLISVYPPNDAGCLEPKPISSSMIIETFGALRALRNNTAAATDTTHLILTKPRHCAHFQFKRICHIGPECHFIHSIVPFV